ncbi:hypothetical protein OJ998_31560 [Solirubrobacter taibaiensis]|nr:hypothetical protein [Solirubrobacter taibaiensis]
MLRRLALAALVVCALPSSAAANPSFAVDVAAEGVPGNLPSKVTHRLTMTAGATPETLTLTTTERMTASGANVAVGQQRAVSATFNCGTKWSRHHGARDLSTRFMVDLTLAPGATAVVETVTAYDDAPWASDTLDAVWDVTPAQGSPFFITSTAPDYRGGMGVQLDFTLVRRSPGAYAVAGTTDRDMSSGRVELWGYAPGADRARKLASVRVRDGVWSVPNLRPSRTGQWEFYARYKSAGRTYADDASQCGTITRIR